MTDIHQHISTDNQVAVYSYNKHFDSLISIQSKELKIVDSLVTSIHKNESEKFLHKFTYDTVFTVVITISIFLIGIVVDRLIKYYDKCIQSKKLNKYFKYYVDKIADKIAPRLSEIYKKAYTENNIDTGIPTSSPRILTGHFERIKNIDDKELFNSINQPEELSTILNSIDFINKLTIEVDTYHSMVRQQSDEIRRHLETKVTLYFTKLSEYLEHFHNDHVQYPHRDEFYGLVDSSILLYYDQIAKSRQLKKMYKKIVRPIQEMVVSTNIFRLDTKAKEIAEIGKDISLDYDKLHRLTTEIRLEYRKFHFTVDSSRKKIIEERTKINWR